MANIDLTQLNHDELNKLRNSIDSEIRRREKARKKEVLTQVQDLLASSGLTLDDLPVRGSKTGAKRGKVPAKYRNPKDSTQTWTGRGRKPKWVEQHLKAGGKIEALEI